MGGRDPVAWLKKLCLRATNSDPGNYNLGLDGNLVGLIVQTINDDAAYSFTPGNAIGMVIIGHRESSYTTAWGMAGYRTSATVFCTIMNGSVNFATTTGALTGTTGTDGKMTVSAHTDGKVYIENRLGVAISINIICLGG